jgi:hypothetical protein
VAAVTVARVSAEAVHEGDPDDPVEILRVLPARLHEQFLREYYAAAALAACQVGGYHEVLRLWRLVAVLQSAPGFESRLVAVRETVRADSRDESCANRARGPGLARPTVSYSVRLEAPPLSSCGCVNRSGARTSREAGAHEET